MEEIIYLNHLYDYYKELLTDKQKAYFEEYYQNNLTLSEIAENHGVSRNAVHKQLKDVIELLKNYENKLQNYKTFKQIIETIKEENNEMLLEKIERIIG